jgi:hypothetical protein
VKPSDISEIARAAVEHARSGSTGTLGHLSGTFPAATPCDIARSLRYAVVICNDQGEFDLANALAPVVSEARRLEYRVLGGSAELLSV